ncbi:hypothetical protein F4818DRAFT_363999 [Hypoxylon cercidicola]|nr:hypothetical protein F4818DRAFT_363999 [Hypoxylon cercidicola]
MDRRLQREYKKPSSLAPIPLSSSFLPIQTNHQHSNSHSSLKQSYLPTSIVINSTRRLYNRPSIPYPSSTMSYHHDHVQAPTNDRAAPGQPYYETASRPSTGASHPTLPPPRQTMPTTSLRNAGAVQGEISAFAGADGLPTPTKAYPLLSAPLEGYPQRLASDNARCPPPSPRTMLARSRAPAPDPAPAPAPAHELSRHENDCSCRCWGRLEARLPSLHPPIPREDVVSHPPRPSVGPFSSSGSDNTLPSCRGDHRYVGEPSLPGPPTSRALPPTSSIPSASWNSEMARRPPAYDDNRGPSSHTAVPSAERGDGDAGREHAPAAWSTRQPPGSRDGEGGVVEAGRVRVYPRRGEDWAAVVGRVGTATNRPVFVVEGDCHIDLSSPHAVIDEPLVVYVKGNLHIRTAGPAKRKRDEEEVVDEEGEDGGRPDKRHCSWPAGGHSPVYTPDSPGSCYAP